MSLSKFTDTLRALINSDSEFFLKSPEEVCTIEEMKEIVDVMLAAGFVEFPTPEQIDYSLEHPELGEVEWCIAFNPSGSWNMSITVNEQHLFWGSPGNFVRFDVELNNKEQIEAILMREGQDPAS